MSKWLVTLLVGTGNETKQWFEGGVHFEITRPIYSESIKVIVEAVDWRSAVIRAVSESKYENTQQAGEIRMVE